MFEPGKILKVKVEIAPGNFGFGRATIVDRQGSQLIIQIKTREGNKLFPKGTRLWFTNDSPKVTFNGMWAASIAGTQLMQGKTMLLCTAPKHEPLAQKRGWPRVEIELPVRLSRMAATEPKNRDFDCVTADLSRSGLTLEIADDVSQNFEAGEEVSLVIHSKELDIAVAARIIRVDKHWIANKTVLGLEFINLESPGQEELDRVLVPLGGRPRNPELEEKARQAMGGGMASWSKTVKPGGDDSSNRFAFFEGQDDSDENDEQ
ncbi:MAG: PilZ domain-containing protein [Cyanobacteria bacterium SZAS LIN-3]|nr:PilZ domain-containing protein [Cyanobacteria bacterium SZAS LIN-3]